MEVDLAALAVQCTSRRVKSEEKLAAEIAAWERGCNERGAPVKWQFTTEEERRKLRRR